MGKIKNLDGYGGYEELEFDDSLWEIIDIPEKVYRYWYSLDTKPWNNYLTQTLHYIGPVVRGEIVGRVPAMDFQFHTFANCRELKEIPEDFKPVNFWSPFYHCSNLDPSPDRIRDFHQITKYCSGKYHGYLLDGCNSPFVVSAFSQEEFFAKWTGYELPQFASLCNWSGQKYSEAGYDFECLKKVLNAVLEQGLSLKEISLVTQGAGIFEVRQLHKTSEIPEECWNKEIVTQDFVIACSYSGAGDLRGDGEFFVGVFTEDFINDTMDAKILSVRPHVIHGSVIGPITATEVVFDGDCIVEAEDSPAIIAGDVLTIKGTGNVVLRREVVRYDLTEEFSMGSGTEAAKEAGKIVILDDNFKSIKDAIWYGRTIYHNILKFCKFQLVINVAAVVVSAIAPFFGIEEPLKVTHLLFVNLVMDGLGAIMLGNEPALEKYMKEKPRRRDESIISKAMAVQIGVMGAWLTILSFVFLKHPFFNQFFSSEEQKLTAYFVLFIVSALFNGFNVRDDGFDILNGLDENTGFLKVFFAVIAIQAVIVNASLIPLAPFQWLGAMFSCVPFGLTGWLVVGVLASSMIVVDCMRKLFAKM